jgi:hypothetical protein
MIAIGRRRVITDRLPDHLDAEAIRLTNGTVIVYVSESVPEALQPGAEKRAVLALHRQERRRDRGIASLLPVPLLLAGLRRLLRPRAVTALAGGLTVAVTGTAILLPAPAHGRLSPPGGARGPVPGLAAHVMPGYRAARRAAPRPSADALALPPRLAVASLGPLASVGASAGLADGHRGRDARALVDLTGPQNHWRQVDIEVPKAIPPLPVAEPVVSISGCINIRRLRKSKPGVLFHACGHIGLAPSGIDTGPGMRQDP